MSISIGSKLLLVCLLLTCYICEALKWLPPTSSTPQIIDSYTADLEFMLLAHQDASKHRAAELRARRQVSEDSMQQSNASSPFNVSSGCSFNNFLLFLNQLDTPCRNAVVSLDTDNVTYLSSPQGVGDIEVFCTEDCAETILEYYLYCPFVSFSFEDYVRGVCSRNNGFRCGLSLAVDDGSLVFDRCFRQTNAKERCRSRCKNAVRDFSNQLGCCINTYYNDTYSTVGILQSVSGLNQTASPWLFDMCGVPYPSECSPGFLMPEPTVTTSIVAASPAPTPLICRNVEENLFLSGECAALLSEFAKPEGHLTIPSDLSSVSELCNTSCAGKYVEQCKGDEISENLGLFCGRNGDQYCGQVIAASYLNTLPHYSCGNTVNTSDNCSMDCHTALQTVSSMVGCCVHAFVLAGHSGTEYPGILESSLWSSCGLELPEQCPHPFLSDTESSGENGGWMAAVFIPLVIMLLALVLIAVVSLILLKRRTNKGKIRPRTRSNASDLDFNESYSRPNQMRTQVRGQTERGFEYTTTASIARHFRMDTAHHRGAAEVNSERATTLTNGELHAERNIYQSPTSYSQPEKIEMKKNEAYDQTSPNSSPLPTSSNRPDSELEYHYVRTDPIVIIRSGEHGEGSDGNIVTELNISYAGNSEMVSSNSIVQPMSAPASLSSKVKPAVMPRKKRMGPTHKAQHDCGSEDHRKEARREMGESKGLTCSASEGSAGAQSGENISGKGLVQKHFKNPTFLQRVNEN